jgi:LacI family transcriptional regulator
MSLDGPRVAVVIETANSSSREILRGIARFVQEGRRWVIFHEPGSAAPLTRRLAQWSGDGIIVHATAPQIAKTVAAACPRVVGVLGNAGAGYPRVDIDQFAVAQLAAAHLRQCGCQSFGFVGRAGAVAGSDTRRAAFADAVAAIETTTVHEFQSDWTGSWDSQQGELSKWLAGLPKPVGIFAADDARGRDVLDAARRAGLSVPDEVAVLGLDDDEPVCELAYPQLSSVRPDYAQVGYRAAELLDAWMQGAQPSRNTTLVSAAEIVVRQSTQQAVVAEADIVRALRFIRQHACNGIRVEQVAGEVNLSRSTLKRRFQAVMKRSVHDEILRVRLGRAQELLAGSDLPLDTIAQQAGFRHQEYMGAVFRAKLGRTPAEFRRLGVGAWGLGGGS